MNKLAVTLLLYVVPVLALADNSLSFQPPPGDYSVVFLANLFGVVDGILAGTGSQMIGSIFAVFNAAILALGGIIITYTLIVSTMNTAHEGQMLGQKWSSIWIPVRSVIGLALLIPKASGYCMMQVFFMWVVIQGIGAADKVWNATLSYLNRGGVIIQAQRTPTEGLTSTPPIGVAALKTGVQAILQGQVCMFGLQKKLEQRRQDLINQEASNLGLCKNASENAPIRDLCQTVVPDFLSSVKPVAYQNANPIGLDGWTLEMPHFDSGPYAFLNGICGSIHWNSIASAGSPLATIANGKFTENVTLGEVKQPKIRQYEALVEGRWVQKFEVIEQGSDSRVTLTPAEIETIQLARPAAIQQMYTNLSTVTRTMVNNDPQISGSTNENQKPVAPWALRQYGVPYTKEGSLCGNPRQCIVWGRALGTETAGVLFNGTELNNTLNSYNGLMMPVLNLISLLTTDSNAGRARKFINDASTQGWIMAGSYFFDLVRIQGSATENANLTDKSPGLDQSIFDIERLYSAFEKKPNCAEDLPYKNLCYWFDGNNSVATQISQLIRANDVTINGSLITPQADLSSTVSGFLNNGFAMTTPGQPGSNEKLDFANKIVFQFKAEPPKLEMQSFDCGAIKLWGMNLGCVGRFFGEVLYNVIIVHLYKFFMLILGAFVQQIAMAFLQIPLTGMATIFTEGVKTVATPGVNPIVALARMGNDYINFAGNLWVMWFTLALAPFSFIIIPMMAIAAPLLMAWIGIMVSIGFVTAFYIPILPYLIFTFGAIGWFMAVIESMIAAPIVALGITHPEGHEAFGKAEGAIMILLNIFLRPTMMIIGYLVAIALSYIGVWILNAGYGHAIAFIQSEQAEPYYFSWEEAMRRGGWDNTVPGAKQYSDWTAIYAFFFSIVTYTSMYLVIVQKSFTLINTVPDKVLRWIGGSPENIGQEAGQWGEEVKSQQKGAADETGKAGVAIGSKFAGYTHKVSSGAKDMASKAVSASQGSIGGTGGGGAGGGAGGGKPPDGSKGT